MSWAHTAALADLSGKTGCKKAILDQFAFPELMEKSLKQKKLELDFTQRVRGEEDLVVAAASILARSAFLDGLEKLKNDFEIPFPKGASSKVKVTAKEFISKYGKEALDKVAKTHFKTTQEL